MSNLYLSIYIPTYNRDSFLNEAVIAFAEQIIACNCQKIVEIVISDNCSSDNTKELGKKLAALYSFINYYRQAFNLGSIQNILSSFDITQGKYIWFFSDDDLPEKDALVKILSCLRANNGLGCLVVDFNTSYDGVITSTKAFFPKIFKDQMINATNFLNKYLYALGFLSIIIIRKDLAIKYVKDTKYNCDLIITGWPQLILSSLIIYEQGNVFIVAAPQVIKRDGNLIYGPKEMINAYVIDMIKIVEILKVKAGIKAVKSSANYPYMFDWHLIVNLYLYYLYAKDLIVFDYSAALLSALTCTTLLILKIKLFICCCLFWLPERIGQGLIAIYYWVFKGREKYAQMKNNIRSQAQGYLDYRSGKLAPSIRTFCKDEI